MIKKPIRVYVRVGFFLDNAYKKCYTDNIKNFMRRKT